MQEIYSGKYLSILMICSGLIVRLDGFHDGGVLALVYVHRDGQPSLSHSDRVV